MKIPAIYIMTNRKMGVLYIGVTSNLIKRVYEHKNKLIQGFTHKYNCNLFVYYEVLESMDRAIQREKQLKAGSRSVKLKLIEETNPNWEDLYSEICRI